ncbi:putative F-box protein At4g17565 [Rosa rugosa]|uniref:putative F-box protein At4g17565 n=1 Tax=Rosa rugosa TaxID=74645 RepID=UPI002B41595E|nr:putative F-box protein At4g17565 [Rosa rugosa]
MSISDWAELPDGILDSILERLELVSDYLHFSLVCWSWNYVAKESTVKAKMMLRYNRPPMLLISSSTKKGKNTWNVYNFINNKVLDLQLEMPNVRFCGSSKGWLIAIRNNFAVTLINPFFRVKGTRKKENSIIHLPPITTEFPENEKDIWEREFAHYAFRATISADPILNTNDCIVAVIYEHRCLLAFIRLGQDTKWTFIDQRWFPFYDVAIVQETCYAVRGQRGELLSFDIATGNNSKTKKKMRQNFCSDVERVAPAVRQDRRYVNTMTYLVDSTQGKLLMVQRDITHKPGTRETLKFEVYELDFDKFWWKKKKTLGDVAIFLGDNSSISVVASHFPGCQPNCIYFNHDYVRIRIKVEECGPHDFGVYNLEDKSLHVGVYNVQDKMSSHLSILLKKTDRLPIWVVPTFQM